MLFDARAFIPPFILCRDSFLLDYAVTSLMSYGPELFLAGSKESRGGLGKGHHRAAHIYRGRTELVVAIGRVIFVPTVMVTERPGVVSEVVGFLFYSYNIYIYTMYCELHDPHLPLSSPTAVNGLP